MVGSWYWPAHSNGVVAPLPETEVVVVEDGTVREAGKRAVPGGLGRSSPSCRVPSAWSGPGSAEHGAPEIAQGTRPSAGSLPTAAAGDSAKMQQLNQ